MKYSDLVEILYGNRLTDIINILNNTVYATDFVKSGKESIVIHTGFAFFTHKQKKLVLLYDFNTETIIRQPSIVNQLTIPQLNGLAVTKVRNNYFNEIYQYVLIRFYKDKDVLTPCLLMDYRSYFEKGIIKEIKVREIEGSNEMTIISIEVFENDKIIKEVPLQKTLSDLIFYDGQTFKVYEKNRNNSYRDTYNDFWEENNQWPGLDPCDYLGG